MPTLAELNAANQADFCAMLRPRKSVTSPIPCNVVSMIRFGKREVSRMPAVPPIRIAPLLSAVPKRGMCEKNSCMSNTSY